MQKHLHPDSYITTFTCSNCGSETTLRSTRQTAARLDVCAHCHPAYTGQLRITRDSSQIDSYRARYPSSRSR